MVYYRHGQVRSYANRALNHTNDLDQCIERISSSKYFNLTNSESLCRTIVDVMFCDRLNILNNRKSELHLNWVPKVSLSTQSKQLQKIISGRADWVLGHRNPKSTLDSSLIVLCVFYHLNLI